MLNITAMIYAILHDYTKFQIHVIHRIHILNMVIKRYQNTYFESRLHIAFS